jgi:hypothetical protein
MDEAAERIENPAVRCQAVRSSLETGGADPDLCVARWENEGGHVLPVVSTGQDFTATRRASTVPAG